MQRKYIYILVVILTITLVITQDLIMPYFKKNTSVKEETPLKEINESKKEFDIQTDLTITNYQNDDNVIVYSYKIIIEGAKGAYKYLKNEQENYLVFTAIGEAELTLQSNESITIYDLPDDAAYKIEQITNVLDKYTTTIAGIQTTKYEGTLLSENNIEFKNNLQKDKVPNKNPITNDNLILAVIAFIYCILLLIASKKIKIQRFE